MRQISATAYLLFHVIAIRLSRKWISRHFKFDKDMQRYIYVHVYVCICVCLHVFVSRWMRSSDHKLYLVAADKVENTKTTQHIERRNVWACVCVCVNVEKLICVQTLTKMFLKKLQFIFASRRILYWSRSNNKINNNNNNINNKNNYSNDNNNKNNKSKYKRIPAHIKAHHVQYETEGNCCTWRMSDVCAR